MDEIEAALARDAVEKRNELLDDAQQFGHVMFPWGSGDHPPIEVDIDRVREAHDNFKTFLRANRVPFLNYGDDEDAEDPIEGDWDDRTPGGYDALDLEGDR